MSVPQRKLSKRRSRMRASHHALQAQGLTACDRCGHVRPSHRVCPNCGHYRGRSVVDMEEI